MPSRRLSFAGHDGHELAGRLEMPAGRPRAYALFAHCFTCGKDSLAAARIARALAGLGVATLRFDFTGLGGSEGDFANTDFSSNVADLVAAAGHLREHHQAPVLLLGHSLGGAAVLAAAHEVPEALGVVTIAAPAEAAHIVRQFGVKARRIEDEGEATVALGGREFRIRRQFLEDVRAQELERHIAGLDRALLVMHSPRDEIVAIDEARRIFEAAKHPKSFVSLDPADHLLTRRGDADYVAGLVAAWAGRLLPEAGKEDEVPVNEVRVREAGTGRYTQVVRAGRHTLLADEPEDAGGDDAGPDPYELLLAGLGACTSMTLRMYAERKSLPLDGVQVRLRHERVHAEDCVDCETRQGQLSEIQRSIALSGELEAAQRERLLQIAEACPVHKTLAGEIRIRTRLEE